MTATLSERPPAARRRQTRAAPPRPRRVRTPVRGARRYVASLGLTVFGLTAWLLLFTFVLSGLQEGRSQSVAYSHLREKLALATVPIGGAIHEGTPIAVLSIPSIGVKNVVVFEGSTSADLRAGPGHYPASPLPGQAGTSVVFGKAVTYGGPFGSLAKLRIGDPISVTTGQGTFRYVVSGLRRPGDPLPQPLATGAARLTLGTADAEGWQASFAPSRPIYVDASLDPSSKVELAPGGAPAVAPAANLPFKSDTGHLVSLVLWLELDLVAAVAAAFAVLRWRARSAWLVGVPIALTLLWGSTNALAPFLPNLV